MVHIPTPPTRLIPNLVTNLKRHVSKLSRAPADPPTFTLFLFLPAEIRLLVYEHYFNDAAQRIAPKSHPQCRHATALLFTSHQIHDEALPVFYLSATLTLDLDPRYYRDVKDYAYCLENRMIAGDNFAGDVSQLQKFRHFHLTLSKPQDPFPGSKRHAKRWQRVATLYDNTEKYLHVLCAAETTLAINIGDVASMPRTARSLSTFASLVSRPSNFNEGWRKGANTVAVRAKGRAAWFLRLRNTSREHVALAQLIGMVGRASDKAGRELRVESSDRSKSLVVTSDRIPDIVGSAKEVVGKGEKKDVWLVIGSKIAAQT